MVSDSFDTLKREILSCLSEGMHVVVHLPERVCFGIQASVQ